MKSTGTVWCAGIGKFCNFFIYHQTFRLVITMCRYSGYGFQTIQFRTGCIKHKHFCLKQGIKFCNIYKQFDPNENWFDWVLMYSCEFFFLIHRPDLSFRTRSFANRCSFFKSFSWNMQTARLSIVPLFQLLFDVI